MTDVTKPNKCYKMWQKLQVWQNMASVTNCDKCEKKSQRNRTEMKGDKFEGVRQV